MGPLNSVSEIWTCSLEFLAMVAMGWSVMSAVTSTDDVQRLLMVLVGTEGADNFGVEAAVSAEALIDVVADIVGLGQLH